MTKVRASTGEARSRRTRGLAAEVAAESFLVTKGYHPLARNHVVRGGEVDLVVSLGAMVVFVEVKLRRRGDADEALAAVTLTKQRRILRGAVDYVQRAGLDDRPLRFDVVAVTKAAGRFVFTHVEGAFDASVDDS